MQYVETIDINCPRDEVTAKVTDLALAGQWQPTFIRSEPISGTPGETGAKTKLVHKFGKGETELIETIEAASLPDGLTCVYETKGVWNRVVNRFTEPSPGVTRWEMDCEFKCSGMMKLVAKATPGMFRKETRKNMEAFKTYAEGA